MIYALIPVGALGGFTLPALQGIMSRTLPPNAQGELQGAIASAGGLAMIIGPPIATQVFAAFIEPGSPWENGYCESFNGKMRYQLLDGEIFYSLLEARVVIEAWRRHYNEVRPHSSLGGRPPSAPETREVNFKLVS